MSRPSNRNSASARLSNIACHTLLVLGVSALYASSAFALSLIGQTSPEEDKSVIAWMVKKDSNDYSPARLQEYVQETDASALAANIDTNALVLSRMLGKTADPQQSLTFVEILVAKSPPYAQHTEIVLLKARLMLKLKDDKAARALIRARWSDEELALSCKREEYLEFCAPNVRAWISGGEIPKVELPAVAAKAIFDARSPCSNTEFLRPNALESVLLSGSMSLPQLARIRVREAWPLIIDGCDGTIQSSESLSAAYGENILRNEYQSAMASVSVERPSALLLFGDSLPLPRSECDFEQASDCSKTKPLTKLSAQRIAQRLSQLNQNLSADTGECINLPEAERERLNSLEAELSAAVEKIMAKKPTRTAAQRLAAIDTLLNNSLSGLDYEMHHLLAKPLVQLAASEPEAAIAVQKKLIAAIGIKASEVHLTQLARLQLIAREPTAAVSSLKQALNLSYDSDTAALLALLEAVQAGARPAFFATPKRPWTYKPVGLDEEDTELSDQDLVYLGALPNSVLKEYRVRRDWNRVLDSAAKLALWSSNERQPKLSLSGTWHGKTFKVGEFELPWPDAFAIADIDAETLTDGQRLKLFEALGITTR